MYKLKLKGKKAHFVCLWKQRRRIYVPSGEIRGNNFRV